MLFSPENRVTLCDVIPELDGAVGVKALANARVFRVNQWHICEKHSHCVPD